MSKYYKTHPMKITFACQEINMPIVQLTLTIDGPVHSIHYRPPIVVRLCNDTHLFTDMMQRFEKLFSIKLNRYIDVYQQSNKNIKYGHHAKLTEEMSLEPIFTALGMDMFEIKMCSRHAIRAACLAIQYGFNGRVFYLQAPDVVEFSDAFADNFMEITRDEYILLINKSNIIGRMH